MKQKIIFAGLIISVISCTALASQCSDSDNNFTGAGLLGGGQEGQLTCVYTDHKKVLQGTYRISGSHWNRTEFGWNCGDAQGFVHSADYCQFTRVGKV